jgi:hypothetical protein
MKLRTGLGLLTCVAFLGGCADAPQKPIPLNAAAVSTKNQRIGVGMTALPKVDTSFPGAGCLLCLAAASIANSALTTHTQTLPYEDIPRLKNDVAELLRKHGADATVIPDVLDISGLPDNSVKGPNVAKKDFSSLRKKYNIDKLVVINIAMLGMERAYSSYIPTSDPKSIFRGTGYMVDLNNNAYTWYLPVQVTKSADGKWDEPPKFPGLTNAYFQALEIGKDDFLKPFN